MSLREFERLLSALLDADRESELLGQAPGCSPAEAEQARRKWLDALGALMNEVSALAAERGEGGEREALIAALRHITYRNHRFSTGCDACMSAASFLGDSVLAAPAPSAPPRAEPATLCDLCRLDPCRCPDPNAVCECGDPFHRHQVDGPWAGARAICYGGGTVPERCECKAWRPAPRAPGDET